MAVTQHTDMGLYRMSMKNNYKFQNFLVRSLDSQ